LKEDVCERLYHNHQIDSSDVTIDVKDGKVTLEGTVGDRSMRFAIEDLVDAVPGIKDIENRVRVERAGPQFRSQGSENPSYSTSGSQSGTHATSGSQSGTASLSGSEQSTGSTGTTGHKGRKE